MSILPVCQVVLAGGEPWWVFRANWLYASLTSGTLDDAQAEAQKRLPLSLDVIGELDLSDGSLVVADPYVLEEEPQPVSQRLRPGSHLVAVGRATVGPGHDRIAAAVLVSGSDPIENWEMACWPGQDVGSLPDEKYFGYPVDAGTGCFASPEAAVVAGRVLAADAGMLEDPISRALLDDKVGTDSAAIVAPEEGALPVAVFSSGWGDGSYPTWLGLSGRRDVVGAVPDVLHTAEPYATPEVPAAAAAPPTPQSRWKKLFSALR